MKTNLTNDFLTVEIKHLGAELCSIIDTNNREFIWEGNPNFWGKHSPVLFPIVGALKNNSFSYEDKTYNLSRHGFAREMVFELIEKSDDLAVFSLKSNAETMLKYPFAFELQISYILVKNKLKIGYTVLNQGSIKMPFSIGAHPAFALPENFEDYQLEFEEAGDLASFVLEDNLVSKKTVPVLLEQKNLPLKYSLFENDALIFKDISSKSLLIKHKNHPFLKINYPDFPDLGIWTMVNAPFICLEPWFGYAATVDSTDNLFEKEGIQLLEANNRFESIYDIEIL